MAMRFAGMVALIGLAALPAWAEPARTASGKAWAEVRRAVRAEGRVTVELRFLTDVAGYSGEEIYADPSALRLEAGGAAYPLAHDAAGAPMAPATLETTFNYDPEKNPRVGTWKAVFVAPPAEVGEAVLVLPNLAPVGPFALHDK